MRAKAYGLICGTYEPRGNAQNAEANRNRYLLFQLKAFLTFHQRFYKQGQSVSSNGKNIY